MELSVNSKGLVVATGVFEHWTENRLRLWDIVSDLKRGGVYVCQEDFERSAKAAEWDPPSITQAMLEIMTTFSIDWAADKTMADVALTDSLQPLLECGEKMVFTKRAV